MIYERLFSATVFILGACVGSFLNVCIYRLPLNLSVNQPRRSFCPSCKKEIPWHQNLPLISWLVLRGRCANCGSRIAVRYLVVELLTALLFLTVWVNFPWQLAIAYCVFVALLIVATFVDFEHFIIPDEVTIGGVSAGIVASFLLPALMHTDRRLAAIVISIFAAAFRYGLLLFLFETCKTLFCKKKNRLAKPNPFYFKRRGWG